MLAVASEKRQGLTTILTSDRESPKMASLRRTLSADMSSRIWVAGNNNPLSSSDEHGLHEIPDSPPIDCPEVEEREHFEKKSKFDTWNSIQKAKKKTGVDETEHPNVWSLILSSQNKSDNPVPAAPYIHPQVKRSVTSLSVKSLDICTESLGSETGSDGYSSYPSSENGDGEEEEKEELPVEAEQAVPSPGTSLIGSRKRQQLQQLTRSRSFPPPLPSLSRQNGASLHVHPRRNNGRLVLEAVSVKEQMNFRAQRQGGRLVLSLIDHPSKANNDHDASDEDTAAEDKTDGGDLAPDGVASGEEDDDDDLDIEEIRDVEEATGKMMGSFWLTGARCCPMGSPKSVSWGLIASPLPNQ
ncbi:hypothetical protein SAY86_008649 [Trapa natans]|uniref:FAF domain-containing protein n=1 Tax=Trapa natans TaxID=22666 RepID=A0AAN7K9U5_TRANT|nr:hypothetical protein SAY86_008649 [Trapa natans]